MSLEEKISLLQEGDTVCVSQDVTRKYSTWLIPFIRFFQNIWNWVTKEEYVKFHHTAKVVVVDGELMLSEALQKLSLSPVEKLKDARDIAVFRPPPIDENKKEEMYKYIHEHLGKGYDYYGTMFKQLVVQLTHGRVRLHSKDPVWKFLGKFYCSEWTALLDHVLTGSFEAWPWWAPEDYFRQPHPLKRIA